MLSALKIIRILKTPRCTWCHFLRNRKGVASIEFAIIVPIMVTIFVGTVELSQAITVHRRVNLVTSSIADLIARTSSITKNELDGIMKISHELMRPYSAKPFKITATNVVSSTLDKNDNSVCWTYNSPTNGGVRNYQVGEKINLEEGLIVNGESILIVEVDYVYNSIIFSNFIDRPFTLKQKLYFKPRISVLIEYQEDENTTDPSVCSTS